MQVILDSSFARPGSASIWGGKKGEFRDWTRLFAVSLYAGMYSTSTQVNKSFQPATCNLKNTPAVKLSVRTRTQPVLYCNL